MKPNRLFSCLLGTIAAAVACTASLSAQTITFDSVAETPTNITGYVNDYNVVLGGTMITNANYPGFNVHVGSGTGTGSALVGQSYLAICVNISYPSPNTTATYALRTNGNELSYDIDQASSGFGDSWATDRNEKFGAIRDIVATFGGTLAGLDQNTAQFQQMMVAMTFAFADIVVDYDKTVGAASLGLDSGIAQFYEQDNSPITSAVKTYYDQMIAVAGTGVGNSHNLYAASVPGYDNQDVVLIPVPEPAGVALLGAAGLLMLGRRRRI